MNVINFPNGNRDSNSDEISIPDGSFRTLEQDKEHGFKAIEAAEAAVKELKATGLDIDLPIVALPNTPENEDKAVVTVKLDTEGKGRTGSLNEAILVRTGATREDVLKVLVETFGENENTDDLAA